MISGILIEHDEFATVCRIDNFSEELKNEIRDRLSVICHGPDAVTEEKIFTSYKLTLQEFNKRYNSKSDNIKKGLIGELLTHVLLLKKYPCFETANPFFNMEERSIKKGFDLIVFDDKNNKMWISEVKSGSANLNNADSFNKNLIHKAKKDLITRFGENETNLWHNAINGAKIALSSGDVKIKINKILEDCYLEASEIKQDSSTKNVILISVIYKNIEDPISVNALKDKGKSIIDENVFGDVIVFSIQKETYQKVAKFLEDEASL